MQKKERIAVALGVIVLILIGILFAMNVKDLKMAEPLEKVEKVESVPEILKPEVVEMVEEVVEVEVKEAAIVHIEPRVSYSAPQSSTSYAPPANLTGKEADIAAIARTLSGECWEHNTADKRGVAEVIMNRVSKGYADTAVGVVTAPNQFMGYYNQSRPTSEDDWAVATQVVEDWYANDQQAFSNYLYFGADGGYGNNFRESY